MLYTCWLTLIDVISHFVDMKHRYEEILVVLFWFLFYFIVTCLLFKHLDERYLIPTRWVTYFISSEFVTHWYCVYPPIYFLFFNVFQTLSFLWWRIDFVCYFLIDFLHLQYNSYNNLKKCTEFCVYLIYPSVHCWG